MALNSPVPGTPTPASGPQGRRDTIGIKRELERELGDFFDLYWRTFSAFMTGRLTKKGFDEAIGPVLSFRQRGFLPDSSMSPRLTVSLSSRLCILLRR